MTELFYQLAKYNFWSGEVVKTGYNRDSYLKKISGFIGNPLVKVLVGQRRCGKSYLMRQIINHLINQGVPPKNIFYLNREFSEFDSLASTEELDKLIQFYREKLNPEGKVYLFLDEIQTITGWEKLINSYSQNYIYDYEIVITGSNSTLLSGELATYLSGRFVSFLVNPFVFKEYCAFTNEEENRETMIRFLKTGGLPELMHLHEFELKFHYTGSLLDTILLRDIVQRYKIKDVWLLENLFRFLTNNIGSLFSVNGIVNYFKSHSIKTNHETILNYLSYLKQSFLIHEVERFNIKGKEILAGSRKFYINDHSFRNYSTLRQDIGLGQNLENYVYMHYLHEGYKIYTGNLNNKEIDFVIEKGSERHYIQVTYLLASEDVIDREFGNLLAIRDNYPKKVISLDDFTLNKEGIEHISAWDLAKK
jgi:predicted AAA+ superfamily ATPase